MNMNRLYKYWAEMFTASLINRNIILFQIDEGWWQGLCKGAYGLFPANYVQLQDK